MTPETLLPMAFPLGEKFVVPEGFRCRFLTYDKDTKQAIVILTDEDSTRTRCGASYIDKSVPPPRR